MAVCLDKLGTHTFLDNGCLPRQARHSHFPYCWPTWIVQTVLVIASDDTHAAQCVDHDAPFAYSHRTRPFFLVLLVTMPAMVFPAVGMVRSAVPQGGTGMGAITGTLVYGDIDRDARRAVRGSAWWVSGVAVRGTWGEAGGGAVRGAGGGAVRGAGGVAAAIGCKAGGGAGDEPAIICLHDLVTTLSEQTPNWFVMSSQTWWFPQGKKHFVRRKKISTCSLQVAHCQLKNTGKKPYSTWN